MADLPSRASVVGVPLFALLWQVPAVCFTGALLTDWAYYRSADMQWANFSAWLLAAGEAFGAAALLALLVDHSHARVRALATARWHAVGVIVVLVLGLVNNFVHSRDAWTSVVPQGITLSLVTVVILLVTGLMGRTLTYRHRLGVA